MFKHSLKCLKSVVDRDSFHDPYLGLRIARIDFKKPYLLCSQYELIVLAIMKLLIKYAYNQEFKYAKFTIGYIMNVPSGDVPYIIGSYLMFSESIITDPSSVDIFPASRIPKHMQYLLKPIHRTTTNGIKEKGFRITTDPSALFSLLQSVPNDELYIQENFVPHANLAVLDKLIAARHKLAQCEKEYHVGYLRDLKVGELKVRFCSKRLKLKKQIIMFNHMLEHQYHLMKYPIQPEVLLVPMQNGIHPISECCDFTPQDNKAKLLPESSNRLLRISFNDCDTSHAKFLYHDVLVIMIKMKQFVMHTMIINSGSGIEILYQSTIDQMGLANQVIQSDTDISGFNGSREERVGKIILPITAGPVTIDVAFYVINAKSRYLGIMGRCRIPNMEAIASTYHQALRYKHDNGIYEIRGSQKLSRVYENIVSSILDTLDRLAA
ncbi:hypothetical protein GIB67_041749 [Kingdonia uniflora]|uniref:Uncharacterized protein n=1 Tax=Kingdonia uniflora TaxID=39325 RepID=A0A7J7P640_9MAGN|nr:hypothetical protein GIB67_041749 [Kingdonia uniflora]